ncbi:hypothetical protein NDU88_008226 [Pleurodeles waltl]|uniref:Uncharacterized protein n=1 Tax=Pleurodeles waltl TaxID=8319 RepID=A0AAV7RRP8_PLEWA|nr:hypothetical protein NDU88_008226 [Pleurodeles waltl]
MGAAGGHPPYHCCTVPLHANNVSPPFSGFPWVLSADDSGGRPEAVSLAQGPSSWAGAVLPPLIRGTSCPGRGLSALQGSRCTPRPAGHRGASSPMSLCGHPGAAPSMQGPSPGPGRHRPLSPRGSTCGARPQCPPGLPVYFRSAGAPRVLYTGASAWTARGGPANAGPFSRAGTALSLQSAGLHTWSATPVPSRAREAPSVRRRGIRKGNSVGAESAAGTQSQPPFYFSFPSEPVGPQR